MFRTLLAASRSARLRPLEPSYHLRAVHQSNVFRVPAKTIGLKITGPIPEDAASETKCRGGTEKKGGRPAEDEAPGRGRPRRNNKTFEDSIMTRVVVGKKKRQRRPNIISTDTIKAEDGATKSKRQRKAKITSPNTPGAEDGEIRPKRQRKAKTTKGDIIAAQGNSSVLKSQSVEGERTPGGPAPLLKEKNRKAKNRQFNPTDDPVAYLEQLFKDEPWTRFDKKRINIASEQLCDDVLERLKPSLKKHTGCDIIELNPGFSIWTKKLHEVIQPRLHILMEPEHDVYYPFLLPLLEAPDSKYKLIPNSGLVWAHLEKLLTPEYLPNQPEYKPGDPRLEERNDTLLFVANLGYHPGKKFKDFDSLTELVLYQLIGAVRAHSLIQRYGRVRMLIWVKDGDGGAYLPRNIISRRKVAMEAEVSCEYIEQVASSTKETRFGARPRELDLEVGRRVMNRMDEAGIQIPPGRESFLVDEILNPPPEPEAVAPYPEDYVPKKQGPPSAAMLKLRRERRKAMKEVGKLFGQDLEQDARSDYIRPLRIVDPEVTQMRRRQEKMLSETRYRSLADKLGKMVVEGQKLDALDPAKMEIYSKMVQSFQEDVKGLAVSKWDELKHRFDNIRAVKANPPVLMWDRRRFEPLRVRPEEFYPQKEMSLLDIQPGRAWDIFKEGFPHNYDVLEFLLGKFNDQPSAPLNKGLAAMHHGAYEMFLRECPSLSDPRKGGTELHDLMGMRAMPIEMFREMLEAWARWPLKPGMFLMMRNIGAESREALVGDEDEINSFISTMAGSDHPAASDLVDNDLLDDDD